MSHGGVTGSNPVHSDLFKPAELQMKGSIDNNSKIIFLTVKILKFGTPQTIAIIVLKVEKFDVTLH